MDKVRRLVVDSVSFRLLVVFIVAAAILFPFIPRPFLQTLGLKAAFYLGPYIILLLIAATFGWICYSRKVFIWTAVFFVSVVGLLHGLGLYAVSQYASQDDYCRHEATTFALVVCH